MFVYITYLVKLITKLGWRSLIISVFFFKILFNFKILSKAKNQLLFLLWFDFFNFSIIIFDMVILKKYISFDKFSTHLLKYLVQIPKTHKN